MIYVGIDIAKLNHFAAAMSSDGKILIEPFKFLNDADGFQLLISTIKQFDRDDMVLCQDLVQHKMRNFNYFQLTNSDSLATLAL